MPGERQSLSRKVGAQQKFKKTKKPSSRPSSTPTSTTTSTPTSTPLSSGGEIFSKILQKGSREKNPISKLTFLDEFLSKIEFLCENCYLTFFQRSFFKCGDVFWSFLKVNRLTTKKDRKKTTFKSFSFWTYLSMSFFSDAWSACCLTCLAKLRGTSTPSGRQDGDNTLAQARAPLLDPAPQAPECRV